MDKVSRRMEFNVQGDLKDPKETHSVIVALAGPVEPHVREMAMALTGTVIRNNIHGLYGEVLVGKRLEDVIIYRLNNLIPAGWGFKAIGVNVKSLSNQRA